MSVYALTIIVPNLKDAIKPESLDHGRLHLPREFVDVRHDCEAGSFEMT
jgi:hypothetical protein